MSDKKVLVTFDLDNDTYFGMLRYCADNRVSIDAFVEEALRWFIKTHKSNTKRKNKK